MEESDAIMIFRKSIYVFSRITGIHVTDDPNEASRWYVAESKDTTDPVVAWCIEGYKKPVEINSFMLLNHVVMNDIVKMHKRNVIVKIPVKRKVIVKTPVKRKRGRKPIFNKSDVSRVMESIKKYGFNKAAGKLEVAKSTLYVFRKKMREQGLWPEDPPEKLYTIGDWDDR